MRVDIVPALSDNYMYLLVDERTGVCAAVDPVEPLKLLQQPGLQGLTGTTEGLRLTTVLTTHHHWDHAGIIWNDIVFEIRLLIFVYKYNFKIRLLLFVEI